MPHAPTIFISSTFYDLRQVRSDLVRFVENELGYRAFASENSSFPIDPDADTIENCRRRVEQDANILILIIGGRYGSLDDESSKSITNLEYLSARAKGIPIYAFIDKQVLAILPVWESNKNGDYSKQVDNTALFEFINKVRSEDKVWARGFETANEIIDSLRTQFAYLMSEGLSWRLKIKNGGQEELEGLNGKALRIALEKPLMWEFELFAQVLQDELKKYSDLRREYNAGVVHGFGEYVPQEQFLPWARAKLNELKRFTEGLGQFATTALTRAFGETGQPGNVDEIKFVARQMGLIYQQQIEWTQRIKRNHVEDIYAPVTLALSGLNSDIIREIEDYGPRMTGQIREALSNAVDGTRSVVSITFKVEISNMENFNSEFDKLEKLVYDAD